MLKVGILGVGNAGNQVVSYAKKNEAPIDVYAINCSEEDLSTIPSSIPRTLVGDGRGAGKNRKESKQFLANDVRKVIDDEGVQIFIKNLDCLFICSSTGGGTGSGISLLLSQIISTVFPTVYVIPVGIISAMKEALSTHVNSLEYLTELYDTLENPTYMLYDNDKFANIPANQMMTEINKRIVQDITVLSGIFNYTTPYASIDDRDMLNLIRTPGRLIVASVNDFKEKDLDEKSLEALLMEDIHNGGHVDIQNDRIVNRIGVIEVVSEAINEKFDTSVPELQKQIGSPVENYEHIYINEDRKAPNYVHVIIAGGTKINDRVQKINDRVQEILDRQKQVEDDNALGEFNLDEINAKRYYHKQGEIKQKVNLENIFESFGVTPGKKN